MNVMIYSDHFYPSLGGSENYALDLATQLVAMGNNVTVVTAQPTNKEHDQPFNIFRINKQISLSKINFNFLEFPALVRRYNPDILHINYQTGGENLLIIIARLFKIPIVLTYHADHVVPAGRLIDEAQKISTFRFVNKILVQTERDKGSFHRKGIKSSKVVKLNFSGIDKKRYACKHQKSKNLSEIMLVCIARLDRLHRYKGIDKLIDLMADLQISTKSSNIQLRIIGDGDLREFYENECKRRELSNVRFLGNLSEEEMILEICNSDFLILPSTNKSEGFGRVALEAMSCGIPVIISKYAGFSELIGKYDAGIVFDPFEIGDLTENVVNVYQDNSLYSRLIENSQLMIKEEALSLEDSVSRTYGIYLQVLETCNFKKK